MKTSFKAVRAALVAVFVLLIAFEAGAQRVRLKQLERKLGVPIGPEREWYIGVTDTFGDQRYKRLDTLIGYIADSISTLNDTDTDEQYADSFYILNDTLYLSLIRDGLPNLKVDLTPYLALGDDIQYIDTFYFDMDTLYISLIRDGVEPQKVYLGDLISLADQDKQRADTFFILDNILYHSLQRDSVGANTVDLSPYLDNTDAQYFMHSGTSDYTNELSGSGGTNFTLIGGTNIAISHDGGGNVTITNSLGPDDDWWKVSTTVPPNNSEDAFRTGKTGIGMNPVYLLDVSEDSRIYGHQIGRGGGAISTNFRAGLDALNVNTSGSLNTAVGAYALASNTTGYWNTAVGMAALGNHTTGHWNTAVGTYALNECDTCYDNTAIGVQALGVMTSGYQNTAVGHFAGGANIAGVGNTLLGDYAMITDTLPTRNVAIGQYSMRGGNNFTGNIGIGYSSFWPATGLNNTYNIAIGYEAAFSGGAISNADYNVGIGFQSLHSFVGGDYNVAVGPSNGSSLSGSNNYIFGRSNTVTGGVDNNVIIGYNQTMTTAGNIVLTNGAGTLALKMLSTGLVGIGETTPTQKLHVAGNARITGAVYDSNNDPGTNGQLMSSTVTGWDWVDPAGASATDLTFSGAGPYTLNSSTGTDVTFTAGSGISIAVSSTNLTISALAQSFNLTRGPSGGAYGVYPSSGTGVGIQESDGITIGAWGGNSTDIYIRADDASANNEGILSVGAGSGTTSLITSTNGASSTTVTLTAGTGITLAENTGTGTITIAAPAVGTVTSVALTGTTGIGVTGSPITTLGTLTLSLNNDLQALEGLAGTGIAVRTGAATWANRSLVAGPGIGISMADGVSGNPTITASVINILAGSNINVSSGAGTYTISQPSFTSLTTGLTANTILFVGSDGTPASENDLVYNSASSLLQYTGTLTVIGGLSASSNSLFSGAFSTSSTVTMANIPTYADDAAAGGGGLTTGRLYKTSVGDLRIKL